MKAKSIPVILLIGKQGQVGWELHRTLMSLGLVVALGRKDLDLADAHQIRQVLGQIKPDVIVNAVAYTAVDKAESETALAMQINGVAPGILAEEAKKTGALLLHYSTDYVFDGTKNQPYIETDAPHPVNQYGHGKLAGEQAIQAVTCDYLILRTTWVYADRGQNFLRTVLRLAAEREELSIVADQIGAPTWARTIAEATAHIVRQAQGERQKGCFESGLYHLSSAGQTSWFGFAEKIIADARTAPGSQKLKVRLVHPITTAQYPLPASRPKNSLLANDALCARFGLIMPTWEHALALCMDTI
ncbi:MAG: dTDP-4-dehydrorhamnose reductase [Gammaproteobacteria bacterium HGW-Gammaproteobacteria-3]|nr:MAG: dTDP-4-dehydrorhamnose reductase [Gammaproteobacteria bacterium HGW-Gammaproteobacteria-3]